MAEIRNTSIAGVFEIIQNKFEDDRGFFSETYNKDTLKAFGIETNFVQDNQSLSRKAGVLRGLHYQLAPHAQTKLIRVLRGSIYDVAIDIRRRSPTFAQWVGVTLSAAAWNQLFIPSGFAHGFLTLEPDTEVAYKTSDFYAPHVDRAIRFDDRDLAIAWPGDPSGFELSAKDQAAPWLKDADLFDEPTGQ